MGSVTNAWRRLVLSILVVAGLELALLVWIPPGWIALASGGLGSIVLIIPPLRLEYLKAGRSGARDLRPASDDLQALAKEIENYLSNRIDEWHEWDAFCLVIGGVLLAFYFGFQGIAKTELVDQKLLQEQLAKFKTENVDSAKAVSLSRSETDPLYGLIQRGFATVTEQFDLEKRIATPLDDLSQRVGLLNQKLDDLNATLEHRISPWPTTNLTCLPISHHRLLCTEGPIPR